MYPENIIRNTNNYRKTHKPNNRKETERHYFYFNFPFISEKVDKQLQNVFRRENLNVRLTRRSRTLRSVLKQPKSNQDCHLRNCPINNNNICNQKCVIYQLKCDKCDNFYIGSTIRPLHIHLRAF